MVQILQPAMFIAFPFLVAIIIFLAKKEFVKLPEDPAFQNRKKKWQKWIIVSRIIIALLLVTALAQPFAEVTRQTSGDPRITVLVDNSTSMEVMDTSFTSRFLDQLGSEIPLNIRSVGSAERSDIGESILENIEQNDNVLLISDGQNNEGTSMGDVSLFASSTNSTISAIDLTPDRSDVSVSILGPSEAVEDVNSTFLIRVSKPGVDSYNLQVTVDGQTVMDTTTSQETVLLERSFSENGYHRIQATVSSSGGDHFSNNNVFYKTVNVIDKPRIVFLSDKSPPLLDILNKLYEVDVRTNLPVDLSQYYAVVVYDMPAGNIGQQDSLSEFLIDGNGMVAFGGFNSFDRGSYKNSVFEQYLPVKVGSAERKFGDNTVVIAIDRSQGGGKCRTIVDTVMKTKKEVCSSQSYTDVIKAQAVELIEQLDETNKVGAVAFDTGSYLIEPIDSLYNNKNRMLGKIRTIQPGGNTLVSKGIQGGYNLLANEGGNRYLILLTDGVTWEGDRQESVNLAGNLYQQGIKLISVGIGRSVYQEFLTQAAANGGGFYVPADNKGRLNVLFGDPDEDEKEDDSYGLVVLNSGHFITQGLSPNAVMRAYNQVIPKSSSEQIISTDTGEPALTVWRYGLGKVAAWTTFTGGNLGDLLNAQNSLALTRTVNWAIGDPERKKAYFVDIGDGRIGNSLDIEVKSDKIPTAEGLNFVKVDDRFYRTTITPSEVGFDSILGTEYAVNYPSEYEDLGMNPELESIVGATGGNLFKPEQVEEIAEFVRTVSRKTVTEKQTIIWPFLLGAIIVFLIEVLLRRLSENKMLE